MFVYIKFSNDSFDDVVRCADDGHTL